MARAQFFVVLALVMFAIIGLARATDAEAPTTAAGSNEDYEEDDTEFMIGTKSGSGSSSGDAPAPGTVVAAPIGGPVPPGAFDNANAAAQATPPTAAASSLNHLSAVAGAATAALAGFFYF